MSDWLTAWMQKFHHESSLLDWGLEFIKHKTIGSGGKSLKVRHSVLDTLGGSLESTRAHGCLWRRGITSNENDSTGPFIITPPSAAYFPQAQDERYNFYTLKNNLIIAPTLVTPFPCSTPHPVPEEQRLACSWLDSQARPSHRVVCDPDRLTEFSSW